MAARYMLSHARLHEIRRYNPNDGWFYHFKKMSQKWERTGSPHNAGYIRVCVDHNEYLAHILAWFYMTGSWASCKVDHINTIRTDNRWANLRLSTDAQSTWNRGLMRTNTTGFTGIYFHKGGKGWSANFRNKHLGVFPTKEAAHEAYRQAALNTYGEFAHQSLKQPELLRHKELEPLSATQLMQQMAVQLEKAAEALAHLERAVAAITPKTPRSKPPHPSTDKQCTQDRCHS